MEERSLIPHEKAATTHGVVVAARGMNRTAEAGIHQLKAV